MQLSFEPADLVDQVMSLGTSNPVEIALAGVKADLAGVAGQVAQVVDFARLFVNQVAVGAGDWM